MSQSSILGRLFGLLVASMLLQPLAATADEVESLPFSDRSFTEPEKHYSATQECVAPEEEMKRNHMNYILHQRDETVYKGVRTRQFALEECINCHATKDESGQWQPVNGPDQFCSSCHEYASVSIDCFQCHATKPERASTLHTRSSGLPAHHKDLKLTEADMQMPASEGQAK